MVRLVRLGENQYMYQDQDTIVCNQKVDQDVMAGIGYFASKEKGRVYFVQADHDTNADKVKTSAPKAFSYEYTSTLDVSTASAVQADSDMVFYAYGGGHYIGASRNFIHRRFNGSDISPVNPIPHNVLVSVRYKSHLSICH